MSWYGALALGARAGPTTIRARSRPDRLEADLGDHPAQVLLDGSRCRTRAPARRRPGTRCPSASVIRWSSAKAVRPAASSSLDVGIDEEERADEAPAGPQHPERLAQVAADLVRAHVGEDRGREGEVEGLVGVRELVLARRARRPMRLYWRLRTSASWKRKFGWRGVIRCWHQRMNWRHDVEALVAPVGEVGIEGDRVPADPAADVEDVARPAPGRAGRRADPASRRRPPRSRRRRPTYWSRRGGVIGSRRPVIRSNASIGP